jgi:Protein of unknown function (DUF3048) N-terminal domain/Protein of unknown function (DUF3048) C-terminal domain
VIERIRTGIERVWTGHKKRVVALGAIVAALVLAFAAVLAFAGSRGTAPASAAPSNSVLAVASPTATPTPTPTDSPSPLPSFTAGPTDLPAGWEYSDLDGVAAPADLAHRLPLGIMIDDYKNARPQSGFSSASIVYQAMIDDSSDRYMMVFQEGTTSDVGPVRSARPYFVYWAAEYKALYGHFGGDAQALQVVIPAMAGNIYNEDDLNGGSCPYHRINTRAAPYNAYTNTAALISCAAKRSYPATYQSLPVRTFTEDTPASERPASQSVTIPYLAEVIGYQYDPATNSYLRLVNGQLQIDPANKQQVIARNIVVMFQAYSIVPSLDKLRPVVANVGSGKAIVFKEGRAITGTWKKTSNAALTLLYDDAGNVIPLVRGEIFMQSVPIGTAVAFK